MAIRSDLDGTDTENNRRRGLGWLWWLLPLLLIPLLLFFLLNRNDDSQMATNSETNSQVAPDNQSDDATQTGGLKAKYQSAVPEAQRMIYFQADTATVQDQAMADMAMTKIAEFYMANEGAQLVVNGSVFDGNPGERGEPLAKERAELIKQQLIAKGVAAADIQTTAINTYTGNTDAARAEYARSVTVDVK